MSWMRTGIRVRDPRTGLQGLAIAVLAILSLALAAQPAEAERRVALVIGNATYDALPGLVNPSTDASDMALTLKSLGFEVHSRLDADLAGMNAALAEFEQAVADADVALVYYAGHGLQLAQRNYLVPVDAVLKTEADVPDRTVSFDAVLAALATAPGIKLVFLDACQDNPLPGEAGQAVAGLAKVGNAADYLIVFATQPGMVAYDGLGRNSPFAEALLTHMPRRGVEVLPMLTAVNADVNAATGGLQTPYVQFSVKPDFYFAPGTREADSPDLQLWRLAARSEDAALLQIYLARFPEGPHAADARTLLARIGGTTGVSGGGGEVEETLWQLGRTSRSHDLVQLYLSRYPDGRHAGEARDLVASLRPEDDPDAPPATRCARLATHPRDATANVAGVSMAVLSRNAAAAVEACRAAVAAHPDLPHYAALLARAEAARGNTAEAIRLFEDAAARGDGRALVSLGLMASTGDGLPRDPERAADLFRRAAERGNVDGSINYAIALVQGTGVARDVDRAVALMREAADSGSAIALFNLAAMTERGVAGEPADAAAMFVEAAERGWAGGWRAAAVLLDEGRHGPRDPAAAADLLLKGVAGDGGELMSELTTRSAGWSQETIRALQERLGTAGYYTGGIDGRAGPKFAAALRRWRLLGGADTG